MRAILGVMIAVTMMALAGGSAWADGRLCSAGGDAAAKLKDICEASWRETARAAADEAARFKEVEWTACPAYIAQRYPACVEPLMALKRSIKSQKNTVGDRHAWGWKLMEIGQLAAILIAAIGTVAAAFADRHWSIKLINITAGALVTAAATVLALYDTTSVYATELRARSEIAELESRIEDSLLWGWALVEKEKGKPTVREDLSDLTVSIWQAQLSDILRRDTSAYVDGSKNRLVKLTK